MAASSCLIPPQRGYDVFLSFRGKDTRKKFTSHLFAALERHRFHTFRDDKRLEKGEDITPELLKAIEDSRISIVIFSKNYAESSWCLNELLKIMECKKVLQQTVLPIFYDVDPSEVRKQKGSFEEAFALHEERFREVSDGKVEKWRETLTDAATLTGWDLQNEASIDEAKVIEEIIQKVGKILNELNLARLNVADHPIGLDRQVQKLETLLRMESNDVHIVVVWGIGGIGKTTIAKEMYNRIHHKFKGSSFLANVRENSKQPNYEVDLQNQLLSDIVGNDTLLVRNTHEGIERLKQKAFYHRKVFLVLDDVDDDKQLKALAINRSFFHPGSRIIITTRDMSSLNSLDPEMVERYEPKGLYEGESLELFSWHAFKKDHPKEDFKELSKQVVHYARGLPLILEVWGSSLSQKSKSEWESAIKKIRKIPHKNIQLKLQISFDTLTQEEQKLFLDIACFFVGMDRDFTCKILEGCKVYPPTGVRVLTDRCLIKFEYNKFVMHDVIRDMGRKIVTEESIEAGKRSRLWDREDILEVLRDGTGSEAVEGLSLNLRMPSRVQVDVDAFEKMNRLWLLLLNNVHLSVGYENINSKRLLWLSWNGFPLKCMPTNLSMESLVALDLSYSSLKQVWKGTKILNKLKFLYLSHCYYLTSTPDFSGLRSLEQLLLNDCIRLVEVDESIKCLSKLVVLNLENCKNLRKLPLGLCMLTSLECLDFSGCSKLQGLVGFRGSPSKSYYSFLTSWTLRAKSVDSIGFSLASIQGLSCLKELTMSRCNLSHLPNEIGNLMSLSYLDLSGNDLGTLPLSISNLTRLENLYLDSCNLSHLPNEIGRLTSLRYLDLSENNLCTLPKSVFNLACLKSLGVRNSKLLNLPNEIGWLTSLAYLCLADNNLCALPESIGNLTCLTGLHVGGNNLLTLPDSIGNLVCLEKLNCIVSQLPCEIGKFIFLDELILDGSNFRSLPDSISNLPCLIFLRLSNCERLQSLPELPVNLEELTAKNCRSLEEIILGPKQWREMCMYFAGCHKLVESKFGNDFRKIFQHKGLFERKERIDIEFAGVELPNWLPYQSTGSYLSFLVPRNQEILGLLVFIVAFAHFRDSDCHDKTATAVFFVHNKTKGDPGREYVIGFEGTTGESRMWVNYLPLCSLYMSLESGDEVEMEFKLDRSLYICTEITDEEIEMKFDRTMVLKEWGVCPIYKVENSNFNSPTKRRRIAIDEGDEENSNINSPTKRRRVVIDWVDDDILQEEQEE